MSTKPRSDAILLNLPEIDKSKLREILLAGMSYADACAFAEKEIGVTTAPNSMVQFWKKECLPIRLQRRAEDAEDAEAIVSAAAARPAPFSEAAKQAMQQRLFNMANNPASMPAEMAVLSEIIQRERELLLKEKEAILKDRAIFVQEGRYLIQKEAAEVMLKDRAADREQASLKMKEDSSQEAFQRIVDWTRMAKDYLNGNQEMKERGSLPASATPPFNPNEAPPVQGGIEDTR